MSDTAPLQEKLKREMASRVVGDSVAPPERWGPWYTVSHTQHNMVVLRLSKIPIVFAHFLPRFILIV
jgi:protease II